MAAPTPANMATCDPKCKCPGGPYADQAYLCSDPCAGQNGSCTFDCQNGCDCGQPAGVYLVTVSLSEGSPIGSSVKYNYVSVYEPYIDNGIVISSGIGITASLEEFACMYPEDCGGLGPTNLAIYSTICADEFENPYLPEGADPSNIQTPRWDAWGIPSTFGRGICSQVCETNPTYTSPAAPPGMSLRRYSELGFKAQTGSASIAYPNVERISCANGYSRIATYAASLTYIGPGIIQDYYSVTVGSGLSHASDTPLSQDLPGPS